MEYEYHRKRIENETVLLSNRLRLLETERKKSERNIHKLTFQAKATLEQRERQSREAEMVKVMRWKEVHELAERRAKVMVRKSELKNDINRRALRENKHKQYLDRRKDRERSESLVRQAVQESVVENRNKWIAFRAAKIDRSDIVADKKLKGCEMRESRVRKEKDKIDRLHASMVELENEETRLMVELGELKKKEFKLSSSRFV